MIVKSPFGRNRRDRDADRRALRRGDAVELACRLRRTSARGWGPWTGASLRLAELGAGGASWHVEDPVSVGLPLVHGPVDEDLVDIDEIWLRPIRFRAEAFWGPEGDILVLTGESGTTELACPPELTDDVSTRLRDQIGLD